MSRRVSSIKNLRTIKALRGDVLKIDLGRKFSKGTLNAWMKKDPDADTYRSFEVIDNRYLILDSEKTKDYFSLDKKTIVEKIEGKWYFDVVETIIEADLSVSRETICTGTILFKNDVTSSGGVEFIDPRIIDINIDGGNVELVSISGVIDGGNVNENILILDAEGSIR